MASDNKAMIDKCLNCKRPTCSGNCAYFRGAGEATRKRREPRKYLFKGEMLTLAEIARRSGVDIQALYGRVERLGWSVEDAAAVKVERRLPMVVEAFGERNTLAVWSAIVGIPASVIKSRIQEGWDPERAMSEPVKRPKPLTVAGEEMTAAELARRVGLSDVWVRKRVRQGWTGNQIVEHYGGGK